MPNLIFACVGGIALVKGVICVYAGITHAEQLWRFASDLAPLAGSLSSRESRAALAAAFAALAKLLPDLQESSQLLTDLNAMSTSEVRTHSRFYLLLKLELGI